MSRLPQNQAPKEARFEALTVRILRHRPITPEQSQEVLDLAAELAVVRRARPAKGRIVMFPSPSGEANNGDNELAKLAQVLTQLAGH